MELFHANIPHSDTIAAAKGKEIKLKKGAEELKKNVGNYVKELRKEYLGDSSGVGKPRTFGTSLYNMSPWAFLEDVYGLLIPRKGKEPPPQGKEPPPQGSPLAQSVLDDYLARIQKKNPDGLKKVGGFLALDRAK
jgi:hypothetical protein